MSSNGPSEEEIKDIQTARENGSLEKSIRSLSNLYNKCGEKFEPRKPRYTPFNDFIRISRKIESSGEEIYTDLVVYVQRRLGKVSEYPYFILTNGSKDDWKDWIGIELMEEWDQNTNDWKR